MVSTEIREKVSSYIKNNPYCTKNQVVNGIQDYSRLTVLQAINELMDTETGKRVNFIRDKPKGFYKLFINDKNEYNQISEQLAIVRKSITELTRIVLTHSLNERNSGNKTGELGLLQSMAELLEHSAYIVTSFLANSISDNIKSINDRDSLYRELVNVLVDFQKLNKILLPDILSRSGDFLAVSRKKKVYESALIDRLTYILSTYPKLDFP